jgi:hypothetical protein
MAFEEGLGYDPSQPQVENYTQSATGLVTKTISLWTRKFVQYVALIGLVSVATSLISLIVVFTIFGSIGLLSANPIDYLFTIFVITPTPDLTLMLVTIVFGIIAFVINAVLVGATIKFALDDYTGQVAEVGASLSYSFGKVGRILGVQIVTTLIISAVLAPSLGLMNLALEGFDFTDPFNPIIDPNAYQYLMMGGALLLVGGIFVLFVNTKLYPAIAIVVDTDLSVMDSLRRSWNLTSGYFLHVLGGVILMGLVIGVIGIVVGMFLFISPYAVVLEVIITTFLFSAPGLIFVAVLYKDLLSRRGVLEGSDLPEYVL